MSDTYYPPGGFYFTVALFARGGGVAPLGGDVDAAFQEVSGIDVRVDTEDVAEGGENRFVRRLPKAARYSNLVLKRGVVATESELLKWVADNTGTRLSTPIVTKNVVVTLLNSSGNPLVAWAFANAWPLRSQIAALNSAESRVLIETIELSYDYFERTNLGNRPQFTQAQAVKLVQGLT